ncbi:MAG: hypothetical protein C0483_15545 [Pirellula sp.]|nr:hypothetical protein [Pirellula sp.]
MSGHRFLHRVTRSAPIAWLLLLALGGIAAAASPEIKSLAPAGGQRGTTTEVVVAGAFDKWPMRAWVSGTGVRWEAAKEKGKFSAIVDADAAPGPRWIRLLGDDGASKPAVWIVGTTKEVAEKETNDLLSGAQEIGPEPTTVNGALVKGGDLDSFRLTLKAGQTLIASLDANTVFGSQIDAILQLVDEAGFVTVQSHDDRGLDPRIVHTISQSGTYYVRLFAFASDPNSSIKYHGATSAFYRLTFTTEGYVDHVFPLAVPRDGSAKTVPQGWNFPATEWVTTRTDVVEKPTALGVPSSVAGSAFCVAVGLPTLTEQEPNDRAKPQQIETPCIVNGRIAAEQDRDVYAVKWSKGQSWRIRAQSKLWGFGVDPLLIVENADGKELMRGDDAGRGNPDADLVFKVPADGAYRIVVEDLFGATSFRHVYLLDIRPTETDFALTTSASEFSGSTKAPLEIPVAIERPTGMTAEITVRLEGLPKEFAEVEAVSSAKGPTAKSVTLKVPAAAKFSGPVRIVGEVTKPAASHRTATTPVAAVPNARTTSLWLTVTGKP